MTLYADASDLIQSIAEFDLWDDKTSPPTITYSFLDPAAYGLPDYYGSGSSRVNMTDNFDDSTVAALSTDQKALVDAILAGGASWSVSFSDVIDITFTKVSHDGDSLTDSGDITLSLADRLSGAPSDILGEEYSINDATDGTLGYNLDKSGVVIDSQNSAVLTDLAVGEIGYYTLQHELTHSLGLADIEHTSISDSAHDNQKYSIMSYNTFNGLHATSLMMLDIAALQEKYGTRNYNVRASDTTYSKDNVLYNSAATNGAVLYTIWDGAGNDTIDASGFDTRAQIDLRQGHFSSIGKYTTGTESLFDDDSTQETGDISVPDNDDHGNIGIAFHTIIENAVGTDDTVFGDSLIGNDWSNELDGRAGDDYLFGDGYVYDGDHGFVDVDEDNPDGAVPVNDSDVLIPGTGTDQAFGGYGDDTFIASDSEDGAGGGELEGDLYHGGGYAGNTGDAGDEIAFSSDGSDTVDYGDLDLGTGIGIKVDLSDETAGTAWAWNSSTDSTTGTEHDSLVSIENVTGTANDDYFIGTDGVVNHFDGGAGADTIDYSSSTDTNGLLIDLSGTDWANTDVIENVENITGSDYDDRIIDDPSASNNVHGGDGEDLFDYDLHTSGVTVDLNDIGGSTLTSDGNGNELASIEDVNGSDYDDTIVDAPGVANYISGGDGTDTDDGVDTLDYSMHTAGIYVDTVAYATESAEASDSDGNIIWSIENYVGTAYNDWFVDDCDVENSYAAGSGIDVLDLSRNEGVTIDLINGENDGGETFTSIEGFVNVSTDAFTMNSTGIDGYFEVSAGIYVTLYYNDENSFDVVYHDQDTGNWELLSTNYVAQDTIAYDNIGDLYDVTALLILDSSGNFVDGFEVGGSPSTTDLSFWGIGDESANNLIGDRNGSAEHDDSMFGYGGDDSFTPGAGDNTVDGGSGTDTVDYSGATGGVTADLSSGGASDNGYGGTDDYSSIENITASAHDDYVIGDSGDNVLDGGAGDDVIEGGGGDDTLLGGAGTDTLDYSGASAGVTVSLASGSASDDGDGGSDTISNFENVIGSAYADAITGSTAANTIVGDAGNDSINGGSGTDTADYSGAAAGITVSLALGTASDDGDGGSDTLSSIENVIGSAHDDSITGSSSANVLAGGAGNDTIDGGSGTDTVDYSGAAAGVTVNLATGSASDDGDGGSDTLSNIENVIGSSHNDTITGSTGANVLAGGAGDDTLDGGAGTDTVDYSGASSGVTVNLTTGTASDGDGGTDTLSNIEKVTGSAYADTITGNSSNNTINAGAGDDTVYGGGGLDTIHGDAGNDTIYSGDQGAASGDDGDDIVYGNSSNNNLNGNNGNDALYGYGGNDTLYGGDGLDTLEGGDGNDTVDGQGGSDLIRGGNGLDTLYGEHGNTPGNDIFIFESASAFNDVDVIKDFSVRAGSNLVLYDALDCSDLLSSYNPATDDIANFVSTHVSGSDTYVSVDADGGGDAFVDVVKLEGITNLQDINTLIETRQLIVAGENLILGTYSGTETLNGTSGADIIFGGGGSDTVYAGDGDDYIQTSDSNILTTVYGEGGDDIIRGAVTAYGGNGDDTIYASSSNSDTLDGGSGSDTLSYASSSYAVTLDLSAGTGSGSGTDTFSNFEHYVGSALDDTFITSSGSDDADGGLGADTASFANASSAVTVDLSAGTATGDGSDTLTSIENIVGSAYADTITGNSGDNVIAGGTGDDTIDGGYGSDTASYVNASSAVTVDLSSGSATGGDGSDSLSHIENVIGSAHNDTITGDVGDNILAGGLGNDTLDGGSGIDTADFSLNTASVTVNLSTGTATGHGTDSLSNFENVIGSNSSNDTITGDSGNNVLWGLGGSDSINGGDGDDTLFGGAGNDSLDGGNGTDTISYAEASAGVTVNLSSGTATGEGTDTLSNLENVIGSALNDSVTGDSGANTLSGGLGNDTIHGGSGTDTLSGDDADDTLYGGDGLDDLTGGDGADTFVLESASAFNDADVIADFTTGDGDAIDITDLLSGYDPMTDTLSNFVQAMNDGSGNSLLQVDQDGTAGTYSFQTVAQISGVTGLSVSTLVSNGNLIVPT